MKRIVVGLLVFSTLAGVVYLATLGCCQWMASWGKRSATAGLGLSSVQRQAVADLEGRFLEQRRQACQRLCEKRAQLIATLKSPNPDSATLDTLVEEVGQEQMALERATLAYWVALRKELNPSQSDRLTTRMASELRQACQKTACGAAPGCTVKEETL